MRGYTVKRLISEVCFTSLQVKWNPEWRIPHALLQKRLLVFPKHHDHNLTNHDSEKLDGLCEWLVKWCGLDYEHATWELDNALLFSTVKRESLIKDYENRRNTVNGASSSKVDKVPQDVILKSSSIVYIFFLSYFVEFLQFLFGYKCIVFYYVNAILLLIFSM